METSSHTLADTIRHYSTPLSIIAAGALVAMAIQYAPPPGSTAPAQATELEESVLPPAGVVLPITWGDLGARLAEVGAIDVAKLEALYKERGGFSSEYRKLLEKNANDAIVITSWNAGYLLNLFWALGLANKNPILEDASEMLNPVYEGAGNFASTGGWTLANGSAMSHYNMHALVLLTAEQQALVDRVSRNIFRPCCGNSTHFPDCNHGMAMLGLLELMASQGVSEEDMYKMALAVNSYWFPDTYLTIARYMQQRNVAWKDVSPKDVLGAKYSSASGFANISSQVTGSPQGGGGCSA
ncbi:TPA: hypothetical protein DIV48_03125 [Candidatus Kaiserbacteria bacterium]|nr:MAG: hypothetical protein UY93_C0003G0107 [Parcubacteria group bacterium GW2011_GWA1_56_13]KKW46924.1 MAG: hypothetical protein UY97_C0002G0035 [Parcubacteria group bacterium GW2011_GWB1_57_6]HCR52606.1 hypothetical protein [Candidatus Kaiserbacteria bacterium]